MILVVLEAKATQIKDKYWNLFIFKNQDPPNNDNYSSSFFRMVYTLIIKKINEHVLKLF